MQSPWTKYAAERTASGKAIEVQLPDGTIFEFPAGTDEATMKATISQHLAGKSGTAPANTTAPMMSAPKPMPVADLARMATGAIDRVEANGGALTPERSADMAQRIAAAKAGTLTVSPENTARAAIADKLALTEMQGEQPIRNSTPALNQEVTPDALMKQARELVAAGQIEEAKRVAKQAVQMRLTQLEQAPTSGTEFTSDIRGGDGMTADQLTAIAEAQERNGRTAAAETTRAKAAALAEKSEGLQTPGLIGGTSGAVSDGFLFGFGDEYMAGLSTVLGVQPDGQGGANWFDYSKPMGERYDTALDAIRTEQGAFKEAEPAAAFGGEVLGSLLGPVKGAGGFINAGTGTAARVGRGALVGATGAGAYGFGEGEGGLANRATDAAIAAPLGLVAGGALTGAGQAFNALRNAVSRNPALREAMPTLEGLRETASGLYSKAREMGGELTEGQVSAMTKSISARINEAGFDRQLHPRVAAVVDRLTSETGPKSLQEMEILRRVASNAAASLQPDERRIAMQVIDAIDDTVDEMGGGSAALGAARETWSRLRRMETIDEAITKAGLTDDFAAGLRNQFKILLRNPRRLRGFSEAQKAAIRAVATGGPVTNGLRQLGKLLSPTGISGAALTGGAAFSGAGVGSLAIPAAGAGMTAIANALTKSRANKALSMAGMTDATRKVIEALVSRPNAAAKAPAIPGLMGYYLSNQ
jgi:hypothetical protein